MAKGKQSSAPTSVAKTDLKTISRKKRTSFERKCLSKSLKRMWAGASSQVFRTVLKAEADARKKKPANTEQN